MHRELQQFGWAEWLVIGGFTLFIGVIWLIDKWMEFEGIRIAPAPHIGMNEPTTIQALVAAEADKQQEQAGAQK